MYQREVPLTNKREQGRKLLSFLLAICIVTMGLSSALFPLAVAASGNLEGTPLAVAVSGKATGYLEGMTQLRLPGCGLLRVEP